MDSIPKTALSAQLDSTLHPAPPERAYAMLSPSGRYQTLTLEELAAWEWEQLTPERLARFRRVRRQALEEYAGRIAQETEQSGAGSPRVALLEACRESLSRGSDDEGLRFILGLRIVRTAPCPLCRAPAQFRQSEEDPEIYTLAAHACRSGMRRTRASRKAPRSDTRK